MPLHLTPEDLERCRTIPLLLLKTDLARAILPVVLQNLSLLDRKQQDYGPANLIKFGVFGVTVRMNDKMERIINLQKKRDVENASESGSTFAHNEPIADSFLDLANYALIAYVMETQRWPFVEGRVPTAPHLPNLTVDKHGGIDE